MTSSKSNDITQTPRYFETILDTVSAPVFIHTPDLKLIFANKAAIHLLPSANLQAGEESCFCHKILFNLDLPCSEYGLACPLKDVLTQKEASVVVRKQETADGQTRWLEITAQPVVDDSGEVVQVVETIRDITGHKQMANALKRFSRSQEEFFLASRQITTTSDLKELYRHIVTHAKDLLHFDFSTLMLFSQDKSHLVINDAIGFPESVINSCMGTDGQGLAAYVAKTKSPDTVVDFNTESRFAIPHLVAECNIRSALCVPMITGDEVLGVLIGHTLQPRTFTDHEILLCDNLANQAAMALYSAQTIKELRSSEDRYHDLVENSLDIIQMVGPDGRISYVNKAWKKALGYNDKEISLLSAFDIIHPDYRLHCQDLFSQLCKGESVELMETTFLAKDGLSFPVEGHINSHIHNGELVSTRGIFRNITQRKLLEDKLQTLLITDELTGLLNRRGFFALAEKQLSISARTGGTLYLLYADLDNMKEINDHKGHKIGDHALMETARLLRETFRDGDIIARVGGDEFAVLLTSIAENQNEQSVVDRFDRNLQRLNKECKKNYALLISTGIVMHKGKTPCLLEDLMSRADHLMYENKRERKKLHQTHS